MAGNKFAIGLLWNLALCVSTVVADGSEPVVTLQQPIQYKQRECDCAGCLRDRDCLRRHQELEGETVARELHTLDDQAPVVDLVRPAVFKPNRDVLRLSDVEQASASVLVSGGDADSAESVEQQPAMEETAPPVLDAQSLSPAPCNCAASTGSSITHLAGCDVGCAPSCDSSGCNSLACDSAGCDGLGCDDAGCDSGCGLLGTSADIDWDCLNPCCRDGFWLRAESLLLWTNDNNIPTLATSSPLGTPVGDAGVLGLPTTTSLYGDPIFGDVRFGGRLRFGWWPTECRHGFEGSIWGLLDETDQQSWSSDGDPILARPFFNVDPLVNAPDAQILAQDGVLRGQLQIETSSEIFGGDIGWRKNICCCADSCASTGTRLDAYVGYRYFRVREGLRISENLESTALAGPTVLGTTIDLYDDFQTTNEFHGGTLGFVFAQQYKRFSAEVVGRLSLGNITREANIAGATTVTVPSLAPVTSAGGMLTQPTNIGSYSDDEFAVLPEIQLNFLYSLNCRTQVLLGYNFMYLGDLVRPGNVVNSNVNGLLLDSSLPVNGPQQPQFAFQESRTWLMGLSLGFEMNF